MDATSKCHDSKIINGWYISILLFYFILTLESILFFCVRLRGTTKEVFVANAIQLAFEHHQLFTHHHVAKAIEITAKYHTNVDITSSSSSLEE
jgi:hypothetical protein